MKHKIVLVPFPFDNLSGAKLRPALCLTNPVGTYQHVVVSFITSQVIKANEPSDLPLRAADAAFAATGLKVDSAVRLHRLVTIPVYLIQRQLGVLPATYQRVAEAKIKALFDL